MVDQQRTNCCPLFIYGGDMLAAIEGWHIIIMYGCENAYGSAIQEPRPEVNAHRRPDASNETRYYAPAPPGRAQW